MNVLINNKRVALRPTQVVGKGGEADIYKLKNVAVKIFKKPDHADFLTDEQRTAARARIQEHQKKLPDFPKNGLPDKVIKPIDLVMGGNKIVGYTMPFIDNAEVLLRYGERSFRQGIDANDIITIFRDLRQTVVDVHKAKVVIGDFNDLNILIIGNEAYLIDADSFQYGSYLCKVYTEKFVDPLNCDPAQNRLVLAKPHSTDSDWYAYSTMFFQSLLLVGPYGGVHKPKDKKKKIPHTARPSHRITVFDPEVKYPNPAIPYDVLPDDLLHHFQEVFEKDKRGQFPQDLLNNLRWTRCTDCGTEHARSTCPKCSKTAPDAVKEVTIVRGKVTCTKLFHTDGMILYACNHQGEAKWLYYENEEFIREGGTVVSKGKYDGRMRFRISDETTIIGHSKKPIVVIKPGQQARSHAVDSFGSLPIFDANENRMFWIHDGVLYREGYSMISAQRVGDVLAGQTLFWVGDKFGFGFYRAAELCVCFVFDVSGRINDDVDYRVTGQLIDATCSFSKDLCWFFASIREDGIAYNHCALIKRDGTVLATAKAEQGDESWLTDIRGKCAAGEFLFSATDDGIVRVEQDGGALVQTREFPDTEPFVDSTNKLFVGPAGLYVVDNHDIRVLQIR